MNKVQFDRAVEAAIRALPDDFRNRLDNVAFMVEEWPDRATQTEMECETPYDLLGLYRGWPITERGTDYAGALPDTIHLYRRPIMAWCEDSGESLRDCIVDTVIHEVAHYYGLSDDDLDTIAAECEWEAGRPPDWA
ncbi:MAG: metallopeptidase family protein [Nitrospirae bacterium]|nr:metallopeptidase family protein [Nitrospirota bacterium]